MYIKGACYGPAGFHVRIRSRQPIVSFTYTSNSSLLLRCSTGSPPGSPSFTPLSSLTSRHQHRHRCPAIIPPSIDRFFLLLPAPLPSSSPSLPSSIIPLSLCCSSHCPCRNAHMPDCTYAYTCARTHARTQIYTHTDIHKQVDCAAWEVGEGTEAASMRWGVFVRHKCDWTGVSTVRVSISVMWIIVSVTERPCAT